MKMIKLIILVHSRINLKYANIVLHNTKTVWISGDVIGAAYDSKGLSAVGTHKGEGRFHITKLILKVVLIKLKVMWNLLVKLLIE